MISQYIEIILTFVSGIIFAALMMPLILRIAKRRKMYDTTDFRKIHHGDIPRLGGISFFPSLAMTGLAVAGINIIFSNGYDIYSILENNTGSLIFSSLALASIFCVGMADDIFGVRYLKKFLIQILCGILLIAGGIYINCLSGIFGLAMLSNWIAWPFTVLMTVFVINAINLIDGIDGLATLLFQITMITYAVIFLCAGDVMGAMMAVGSLAVTIPFLRYNLWGNTDNHSKIFMGDTGSMTLGLLIVIIGIRLLHSLEAHPITNPVLAVISPIIVPCFDTIRVYLLRLKTHKSPFLPDRNHIHHCILRTGLNQHKTLVVIIAYTILVTVFNLIVDQYINANFILLIDVIVWIIFTYFISNKSRVQQD